MVKTEAAPLISRAGPRTWSFKGVEGEDTVPLLSHIDSRVSKNGTESASPAANMEVTARVSSAHVRIMASYGMSNSFCPIAVLHKARSEAKGEVCFVAAAMALLFGEAASKGA